MKFSIIIAILLFSNAASYAQLLSNKQKASRADVLRGTLTPLRTAYDIHFYHLDVEIDIDKQSISGSNEFHFTAVEDFNKLQFDLFENLEVELVEFQGKQLPITREANAVFITFPKTIEKGNKEKFKVWYAGSPRIAINAPWDGGFTFSKDNSGNPFVSVSCQGLGASVWWPNKDHQSDEVDSMKISVTVPKDLHEISNGRLLNIEELESGSKKYNWFIAEPINNYNVVFYIGKYTHWTGNYKGENGDLSLDYWALSTDYEKAKSHWEINTKNTLQAFEYWFGPYPFYKSGFKLVQSPYLGMEHQSAIAYGNQFKNGYLGADLSGTGHGLKWDYIVVHEAGHEWWGNNITTQDIADMWVHEGFTTYSEALFTEHYYGKPAGAEYVRGLRKSIQNKEPLIGQYGVNKEGSPDMYFKGANLIHTIRSILSNDVKFRKILRGLNQSFYHKTVNTNQIERYISIKSDFDFSKIFEQYLRHSRIPTLEYRMVDNQLMCKWISDVPNFNMPIKIKFANNLYRFIQPSTEWQTFLLGSEQLLTQLEVDPDFYINIKKLN